MSRLPPVRPFLALWLALAVLGGAQASTPAHADATGGAAHPSPTPAMPAPEETVDPAAEARSLLGLGASLTERKDYLAAEIAYRRVLGATEFPKDAQIEALLGLARMFRRDSSFTKAAAIYEKYLKEFADDGRAPEAMLELGRTLRAMGAYKMAIARFYSVINSTLKLPGEGYDHYQLLAKTAQFEIAETHFESGNFIEASKFFSRLRLLDLAPADRARAHFKSAYALELAGDHERAVTTLRQYLGQWADDEHVPEARYLLATTLRKLGRANEALMVTLELLRSEKAANDPQRWAYWQRRTGNQLANEFFQAGDTANALAIYQGLANLSTDPRWNLPITYQIALCHERLRLIEPARRAYRTIIDGVDAAEKAKPEAGVPAELKDLAKMASWRLANMDWTDETERKLTQTFSSTTGQAPDPTSPSHDSSGSPAAAPAGVR